MILFLDGEKFVQLPYLRQAAGGMQFGDSIVIADEGMEIGTPVDTGMVMAMVAVAVAFDIKVLVIGDDGAIG